MIRKHAIRLSALVLLLGVAPHATAADAPGDMSGAVLQRDGLFWKAYNACDVKGMAFYVKEKGKPELLDGRAKFTDLWMLKDGTWKMSRILIFDHGPAVR